MDSDAEPDAIITASCIKDADADADAVHLFASSLKFWGFHDQKRFFTTFFKLKSSQKSLNAFLYKNNQN